MKIAIIGAGLMGRLLALSLLRAGKTITLFDKDTQLAHQSAAYAAAGLLTPLGESLHCEPNIVAMGLESLNLWPDLLGSLKAHTFFQRTGAIMVSHEQDKGDYQRMVRHLEHHYPKQILKKLDRVSLTELEPEIGRSFNQGIYLPQEGQLGNRRLLIALKKALITYQHNDQLIWHFNTLVTTLNQHCSQTNVHYQQDGKNISETFDLVIDCRGTGATVKNSPKTCLPINNLRSVRGELFQLFAPDVHISRPIRLMHPRYQLYIAPKQKGFYVVGATEIESDDNSAMTVRSAMELLSAAYSVHPGFAEANIRQHVSQCRPAFDNNQPQINHFDNIIQVNGLFRHGFLIAPVVLAQVENLVLNICNKTNNKLPYNQLLPVNNTSTEVVL